MKSHEVLNSLFELYSENKFAHAYLIETNNIELCLNDIKELIKMTFCPKKYSDKCSECNLCRLLDNNSLPSVVIIEPNGKTINKEAIDILKDQFAYNPIYTQNNYYIIVEAEKMNDTAYNKLLKFLEEPEDNIIGFYICSNIQKMPETVVSRLEQIKLYYDVYNSVNEDIFRLAKEYLSVVTKDNSNGIWYNNNVLMKEITERVDYIELFKYMLNDCIHNNNIQLANIIKDVLERMEYNVNIPLTIDSFVIKVGELYGL